ncbi:hypothetical protein [Cryptosporangium phraense]|uniref:Uncharacterized protein n=1 Tax=Cryptosporangium phraense TaxID=2593070 RepID=A0A545AX37_9ACTN|nr:hypothetical protein [Cryptosporangium phraense]TQS45890.1 hypothetical protein FL583_05140 [Cryptosporangium phraense]
MNSVTSNKPPAAELGMRDPAEPHVKEFPRWAVMLFMVAVSVAVGEAAGIVAAAGGMAPAAAIGVGAAVFGDALGLSLAGCQYLQRS